MNQKKWSIKELLDVTTDYLNRKDIDNPRLCAEVLLAHQLNTSRVKLYLDFDQPVGEGDISSYRALIKRRLNREPLQHITGTQEFWSLGFIVGPQVLIPRPETEILVEQVVRASRDENGREKSHLRILDLGTGSGVIAVSLARELKGATLWASDISEKALELAKKNSIRHGVDDRIHFLQGDLFQPFAEQRIRFHVIVCNPPYIASEDFDSLPPEVRDHEPRTALDGREGGLFFIEKIIHEGPGYLKPGGRLFIEMDPGQVSRAMGMMEASGLYAERDCIKDYSHKNRIVEARTRDRTDSPE